MTKKKGEAPTAVTVDASRPRNPVEETQPMHPVEFESTAFGFGGQKARAEGVDATLAPEADALSDFLARGQAAQRAVDAELGVGDCAIGPDRAELAEAVAEQEAVRRALTEEAIEKAMAHIEAAQNELSRAAAELSKLEWGSSSHQKCQRLYDQVHKFWYAVRGLLEKKKVRVDSWHLENELKRRAGGAR